MAAREHAMNENLADEEERKRKGMVGAIEQGTDPTSVILNVYGFPDPRFVKFEWPDSMREARKVQFSGHVRPGHVHPEWGPVASALRDQEGRLLPNLLRKHGLDPDAVRRIGVVAFSAGSNSGLRELLRHPEDRAALTFALALDGLHAARKARGAWHAGDVPSRYFHWRQDVGPWFEAAKTAAHGNGLALIATSSNVAAPGRGLTKTVEAHRDVLDALSDTGGGVPKAGPASRLWQPFTGRYDLPAGAPQFGSLAGRKDIPRTMTPTDVRAKGRLLMMHFPGSAAVNHVDQAWIMGPWLLRNVADYHWQNAARANA